jgi:hypothetical protein
MANLGLKRFPGLKFIRGCKNDGEWDWGYVALGNTGPPKAVEDSSDLVLPGRRVLISVGGTGGGGQLFSILEGSSQRSWRLGKRF